MKKQFETLGPKWKSRRFLPRDVYGFDILGMWQLSKAPQDRHIAVAHCVPKRFGGGWYDDVGHFISKKPPIKWAPIPNPYE